MLKMKPVIQKNGKIRNFLAKNTCIKSDNYAMLTILNVKLVNLVVVYYSFKC